MKKRILTICILATAALSAMALLTGCSNGEAANFDYLVTFDYNTGGLELSTHPPKQYLGIMEGGQIMAPINEDNPYYGNASVDFKEHSVSKHALEGWYLPQLDASGKVMTDENGTVLLDRKWDFSYDRVTKDVVEHYGTAKDGITLYANLELMPSILLYYTETTVDEKGETVTKQRVIREKAFMEGSRVREINFVTEYPIVSGHTFAGFYSDQALTQPFSFGDSGIIMGAEDFILYARYVEGENFSVVTTAEQFLNAYVPEGRIYVDADIDFTGVAWKDKIEFDGIINGNGYTLRNITCNVTGERRNDDYLGLFGKLCKNSNIHDVTFENVTVVVSTTNEAMPAKAGLLAWEIDAGATIKNVTLSGTLSTGKLANKELITLWEVASNYDTQLAAKAITVENFVYDITVNQPEAEQVSENE